MRCIRRGADLPPIRPRGSRRPARRRPDVRAGHVRRGWREDERSHAAELGRLAEAPEGTLAAIAALCSSTDTPSSAARSSASETLRSVAKRPGETPFTRTAGASWRASVDQPRHAGPQDVRAVEARHRLADGGRGDEDNRAVVAHQRHERAQQPERPGDAELERLLPLLVRQLERGPDRRSALVHERAVERAAERVVRPPVRPSRPPPASRDRPDRPWRASPSSSAAAPSDPASRPSSSTRAPPATSSSATARPSPRLPPPTTYERPSRPRSTAAFNHAPSAGRQAQRRTRSVPTLPGDSFSKGRNGPA